MAEHILRGCEVKPEVKTEEPSVFDVGSEERELLGMAIK
jgi:hypothetical protein